MSGSRTLLDKSRYLCYTIGMSNPTRTRWTEAYRAARLNEQAKVRPASAPDLYWNASYSLVSRDMPCRYRRTAAQNLTNRRLLQTFLNA